MFRLWNYDITGKRLQPLWDAPRDTGSDHTRHDTQVQQELLCPESVTGTGGGVGLPHDLRSNYSDMLRLVRILHWARMFMAGRDRQLPHVLFQCQSSFQQKIEFLCWMTHHMLRIKQKALCNYWIIHPVKTCLMKHCGAVPSCRTKLFKLNEWANMFLFQPAFEKNVGLTGKLLMPLNFVWPWACLANAGEVSADFSVSCESSTSLLPIPDGPIHAIRVRRPIHVTIA